MSAASPAVSARVCTICYNDISSSPEFPEEQEMVLRCHHVFHSECIGRWFQQKHNCPLCRVPVAGIATPEARRPEMTREEILAVPDHDSQVDWSDLVTDRDRSPIRAANPDLPNAPTTREELAHRYPWQTAHRAPSPPDEVAAIPLSDAHLQRTIRQDIDETRDARRAARVLNLSENTPLARTARRVQNVALQALGIMGRETE